ncbi:MAG: hypothetical protein IJW59_01000 [Clostridia bacterium]|nr:hypothetical protein [Clostridia bacterium]
MDKENLKIAVVGGGNVGRVLSTLLMCQGYDVELVCRSNHQAIKIDNSYAFQINGDFGTKSYLVPFVKSIDELSSKKDIIFFATKCFDMLERVGSCLHKLTPKGTIVTIQNVYSINKLMRLIPPECSVCMVCDFACTKQQKEVYVTNSNGATLGVYNKKAVPRMNLVSKVLGEIMKVHITNDIVGFTMGRNIINGAISLLGGISGLRVTEILESKVGRKIFFEIIKECVNVCNKWRIKIVPYNFQLDYYKLVEKGFAGYNYRRKIARVLQTQNGHIKSSALDDLEKGERTELRCMLDSVITLGKKAGVKIPCIEELDEILSDIETGKQTINPRIFCDNDLCELMED